MLLQRFEVGDARRQHEGDLAVEKRACRRKRQQRLGDGRKAHRPVESAAAEQSDVVASFAADDAVAVVLDLMQPVRPGRTSVYIRDAKAPLPASRLGDPHAADLPRPVAAIQQLAAQRRRESRPGARAPARSSAGPVQEHRRSTPPARTPLSGCTRSPPPPSSSAAATLSSWSPTSAPRTAQARAGPCPLRRRPLAGCRLSRRTVAAVLPVHWPWSPSLPAATARRGWDRLSTALRYYATIRLLSSLRHLVLGSSTTTAHPAVAEAERSPRVRTQNFVPTPSPLRTPPDGYRASPPEAGSPAGRTPHGASLSLGSALHLGLPPDPPRGRSPCPFGVGFPSSGSPEDFHLLFCAHAGRTSAALRRTAESHPKNPPPTPTARPDPPPRRRVLARCARAA